MGRVMTEAPEDTLLSLFESERAALLSGDLSTLQDTADRKLELATAIAGRSDVVPRAQMIRLAEAAQRNAELCEAARRGVRDVIDRISERARVANQFETYGADGRRQRHVGRPPRLEKRS